VDGEQRGVIRIGVGEEQVDLAPLRLGLELVELASQVRGDRLIGLLRKQGGEVAGVGGPLQQPVPARQLVPEAGGVLVQRPGAAGVVPEVGRGELALQRRQA
jgi:hypothetical protein